MNFICNFCNSNLSTLQNLTRHKKSSKKCKIIQNNKIECFYCNNCFDKETANIHILECSKIKLDEKENTFDFLNFSMIFFRNFEMEFFSLFIFINKMVQ